MNKQWGNKHANRTLHHVRTKEKHSKRSILICRCTLCMCGFACGVVYDGTERRKSIHSPACGWLLKERPVEAACQHISPEVNDPPHLGATSIWWHTVSSRKDLGFRCWCPQVLSSPPTLRIAAVTWPLNNNACPAGGANDPAPELHTGVRAWCDTDVIIVEV